jgi:NAD(P)-dependent dehydrogenase (short-subunit alcohol dehydrogenase family)
MRSLAELQRLDGRVAVVTGGGGHLGRAMAAALAEMGASLVLVDVDGASVEAAASSLAAAGAPAAHAMALDLTADGAAAAVVGAARDAFGRLDVVVNNAALTGASGVAGYAVPFGEQSLEAWQAALDVNLTAAFSLVHAARDALAEHGVGSVVNVASIYGLVGPNLNLYTGTTMGNPAAYAATKGGLIQLTRYLATVLAPAVRVNAIAPGGVARNQDAAFVERYERLTPLGRMATEEDVKGAVAFLASDASAYVTGQVLAIDGGWTAW